MAEKGWRWSRGWIGRVILLLLLPCHPFSQMGTEGRKASGTVDCSSVATTRSLQGILSKNMDGAEGGCNGGRWRVHGWLAVLGSGATRSTFRFYFRPSSKHRSSPLAQCQSVRPSYSYYFKLMLLFLRLMSRFFRLS